MKDLDKLEQKFYDYIIDILNTNIEDVTSRELAIVYLDSLIE